MTSAEAHPSTDVLAELAEGSLDEAVTSDSQMHVDQCSACQAIMEQLRGVTAALRQLPAEVAVPEHVSARLSAALAAEAAGTGTQAAGTRAELAGRAEPAADDTGPVAWFRRRAPQALALAATVAVLGLVGYVVTTDTGGSDMSTAGSGGDSGEEAAGNAEADTGPGTLAQDRAAPETFLDESAALGTTTELEAQVEQVWEQRTELAPGCGDALADELGLDIVGSVESGSGVLIVLSDQEGDQLRGEVVPTCGSTTAESLTSPVVIDIPR